MSSRMKLNSDVRSVIKTIFVVSFCIALVACNREEAEGSQIDAAGTAKAEAARQAEEKAMAALSRDELTKLASTAFREQRLYAPAGNNALEYYLALRKKLDAPDPIVESALMDLAPYTVIAAEQAITRLEFDEAARLRDLITTIDPDSPSLPRLSRDISDGLKVAQASSTSEIRQQQEALIAVKQAEIKTTPEVSKPEITEIAAKPATTVAAIKSELPPAITSIVQANVTTPSSLAIATVTTPPVPAKKSELIAVRTPEPGYPSDALNRGLSGEVEIEFIVERNGDVSGVRVVNSSQRAFDRNVVMTVKRWKFAPLDTSRTVRRSFNFNNPG